MILYKVKSTLIHINIATTTKKVYTGQHNFPTPLMKITKGFVLANSMFSLNPNHY